MKTENNEDLSACGAIFWNCFLFPWFDMMFVKAQWDPRWTQNRSSLSSVGLALLTALYKLLSFWFGAPLSGIYRPFSFTTLNFTRGHVIGSCLKQGWVWTQYTCLQSIPSHFEEAATGPWMDHALLASFNGLPLSQCTVFPWPISLLICGFWSYFHLPRQYLIRIVRFDKFSRVPFGLSAQTTSYHW